MPAKRLRYLALISLIGLSALSLTSCADQGQPLAMASMDSMPGTVQAAPARTQEAYQFAAANADLLGRIPCYCGCYKVGHKSNYDCYIAGVDAAGRLTFNDHALGCVVCIDITQDVLTRLRAGEKIEDVQAYIERAYSHFGPPTRLDGATGG